MGQVSCAANEEDNGGDQTASHQIDGVVVTEVHGCPPEPTDVEDEEGSEFGEAVAHEESDEGRITGVQTREGAKGHWGGREASSVHVYSKQGVDASQSRGGTGHAVVGGREAIHVLVPRRGARKHESQSDADNTQPSERFREDGERLGGREQEDESGADGRVGEVANTIGNPGEDVEDRVGMRREDVGQVGAVEDVLKSGEHLDPNVRSHFCWDKPD